jgi:IS30 family transposase
MVRRRISEAQRWQIFGMHTTGMSVKAIGRQMGYHYTIVSRLVRRLSSDQWSCAMSLNSNHVVLNTMPNVFVDVVIPAVDV